MRLRTARRLVAIYLCAVAIAVLASCTATNAPATSPAAATTAPSVSPNWVGVYASTGEVGGFAGTVLHLARDINGDLVYRMRIRSDVYDPTEIQQSELRGDCLTVGGILYLPTADGYVRDGKTELRASLDKYALMKINGHDVLMRADAAQIYKKDHKLYDYGILIKVSDESSRFIDLTNISNPSVKLLYADPTKPWSDPYISPLNDGGSPDSKAK
jgi:hypothetical protein